MRTLFFALWLAFPATDTPEPPKAAPSVASIKARRDKIAALVREDQAEVKALLEQLKTLGIDPVGLEPLAIGGKPGPRGPPGPPGPAPTDEQIYAAVQRWFKEHPPTPPTPPPDPPPVTPTAEKLWVIVLEETADRNATVGRVLGDLAFWQSLKALGNINYAFYDQNNPGTVAQSYVTRLGEINARRRAANLEPLKLPVVFYVDPTKPVESNVLIAAPLPGTTSEIRSTVKTITGK